MAIYLSEDDVRQVVTMPLALEAVEAAMRAHGEGRAIDVPRQRTRLPQTQLHILQGALPDLGVIGYKAYTSNREGVRFRVHLFDAASGRLSAVVSADLLGMMRTGAVSGLATRLLARPDAAVAGVFGAGWQAEGHLEAIAAVRPLRQIKVFARDRERLAAFCARMTERLGIETRPAASTEETVGGSDIVGTITTAASPLFDGSLLAPGTHVNAAGSNALIRREIDERTVARSNLIVVDSVDVALREAGDLQGPLEKGRIHAGQLVELGRIVAGTHSGRASVSDITLFESQGMAIQDLALAVRVVALARERGLGIDLPLGD